MKNLWIIGPCNEDVNGEACWLYVGRSRRTKTGVSLGKVGGWGTCEWWSYPTGPDRSKDSYSHKGPRTPHSPSSVPKAVVPRGSIHSAKFILITCLYLHSIFSEWQSSPKSKFVNDSGILAAIFKHWKSMNPMLLMENISLFRIFHFVSSMVTIDKTHRNKSFWGSSIISGNRKVWELWLKSLLVNLRLLMSYSIVLANIM